MTKRILLPCLRGSIGNWVTYTCLMRFREIVDLISFAEEIHTSKKLSKMIQRQLKKDRQEEIGEYLLTDEEAFFNSLVVAIYDGEPKWHQFDSISNATTVGLDEFETFDYASESLGYLSLTKNESIFALDGQHRLSGIQYAIDKNPDLAYKQLPVTFLPHFNDEAGLKRTRRLFTTLNKKAKPVDKAAIISLDEDDLAACITRYLVENNENFSDDKIKFQANNNISYKDTEVTTIGNLYDLVKIILKDAYRLKPKEFNNYRGNENEKNRITLEIVEVFDYFFSTIPELNEFQTSSAREETVMKYRTNVDGGNFLYRPIGLKVYMLALCKYFKKRNNDDGIDLAEASFEFIDASHRFSLKLESELLLNRIWNKETKRILPLTAENRNLIIDNFIHEANLENNT